MKLSKLLETTALSPANGVSTSVPDPEIRSIHYRSQGVTPGGLFVAIPGHSVDGHDYIDDAVARGASAVIAQKPVTLPVPCVRVANSRIALARVSAAFYGAPSDRLSIVGITGTNGKTTVTYLVESMLTMAGKLSGVVGTINYRYSGQAFEAPVTTPESFDLQRILAQMNQNGVTHVAMEVSSHGIDLARVEACNFDVVAFTNLTRDHLDYHGTMAAYWACKKRLFTDYLNHGTKKDRAVAVLNADTPHGRELIQVISGQRVIAYGVTDALNKDAIHVRPLDCVQDGSGIHGEIMTPAGSFVFYSTLVGRHNLENILCAVGIGLALNLPLSAIQGGIGSLGTVPGRLEPVENTTGRYVYVDYAHTPDALENVLTALEALNSGRLICVFGCGGDRDREKRPLMGKIAAELADVAVITSDNPRTEDPEHIIQAIVSGIPPHRMRQLSPDVLAAREPENGYMVVADRREAIRLALTAAEPGDMVLIAGKGHETYQILATEKVPFDDREIAEATLLTLEKAGGKKEQ